MDNKKKFFFVREIVFNRKGQIFLKQIFLSKNNNTFYRVLRSKR